MTQTRFDPLALVGTTLFNDLNRLFDLPAAKPAAAPTGWTPRVDVAERGDAFIVRADLAGISPDEIEVTVDQDILTISGNRAEVILGDDENGDITYRRREIITGEFARKIRLGAEVDIDGVSAHSVNGILEVTVPKQPAELPRKVTVAVQR